MQLRFEPLDALPDEVAETYPPASTWLKRQLAPSSDGGSYRPVITAGDGRVYSQEYGAHHFSGNDLLAGAWPFTLPNRLTTQSDNLLEGAVQRP